MKMPLEKYDFEGKEVIDPPTLPEYEERISAYATAGDDLGIQEVQKEYDKERVKRANAHNERADKLRAERDKENREAAGR